MIALKHEESTYNKVDEHSRRVEKLTEIICRKINISEKEKNEIIISARMHDIGKKVIDPNILNKAEKLNETEWDHMKKHLRFGYIIAKNMKYSENICKNILYHHENYDGTGYPYGLKDEKIPLGAKVIRVCDTYDAIRSKRSYKERKGHLEAIEEIIKNKEKYDKDVLKLFLNIDFSNIDYG